MCTNSSSGKTDRHVRKDRGPERRLPPTKCNNALLAALATSTPLINQFHGYPVNHTRVRIEGRSSTEIRRPARRRPCSHWGSSPLRAWRDASTRHQGRAAIGHRLTPAQAMMMSSRKSCRPCSRDRLTRSGMSVGKSRPVVRAGQMFPVPFADLGFCLVCLHCEFGFMGCAPSGQPGAGTTLCFSRRASHAITDATCPSRSPTHFEISRQSMPSGIIELTCHRDRGIQVA